MKVVEGAERGIPYPEGNSELSTNFLNCLGNIIRFTERREFFCAVAIMAKLWFNIYFLKMKLGFCLLYLPPKTLVAQYIESL